MLLSDSNETFTSDVSDYEAIENIASMYNSGKVTAEELSITGDAEVSGNITSNGQSVVTTKDGSLYVEGSELNIVGDGDYKDYVSRSPLETTSECPSGYVMCGLGFYHNSGENYTYQEKFRIKCCKL
jgi:archaellum component FlaF (FlaF/FlaG flagellin family)